VSTPDDRTVMADLQRIARAGSGTSLTEREVSGIRNGVL